MKKPPRIGVAVVLCYRRMSMTMPLACSNPPQSPLRNSSRTLSKLERKIGQKILKKSPNLALNRLSATLNLNLSGLHTAVWNFHTPV